MAVAKITERSFVERALVVFHADGTLRGAHQESVSQILRGDEVINTTAGGAVPIDADTLAAIVGEKQASLIAQNQELMEANESLTNELAVTQQNLHAALFDATNAKAQLEQVKTQLEQAKAQLKAATETKTTETPSTEGN